MITWSAGLSILVVFIALAVLTGWAFDISFLKRPVSDLVPMNPTSAFTFILSGISFLLLTSKKITPQKKTTGLVLALIVLLTGFLKIIDTIFSFGWQVDQVLFLEKLKTDIAGDVSTSMAPNTAFCFLLVGLALLLLKYETPRKRLPSQYITLIIGLLGLLSLIGYLYSVKTFHGILVYIPMAIHTAICFLLLSIAILFANAGKGIMKEFTGPYSGSILARKLIPAAILVPVLLGYLRMLGYRKGVFTTEFGVAILMLSIIIVLIGIIWYYVTLLNKRDFQNKQIETSLRQSEEQFKGLLESAPDAIVIVNGEGKIILINQQTTNLFGYSKKELSDQRIEILIPVDFHNQHVHHRDAYFKDPKVRAMGVGLELFALRKDGSQFPVEISLSPLQTSEGLLVSAAIRDITERKKAEEQLEAANKELEAFSYSVSHDLRAPLRIIDGYAEILTSDYKNKLDQEGNRVLAVITENARKMGKLIDDLLNLSRQGRKELVLHFVDMTRLVESIIAENHISKIKTENIRVSELAPTYCDISLIRQVWVNLISNAAKYSAGRNNPCVEIGSAKKDNEIIYSIKDNGVGFDMKYADKLFGVFQRLHKATDYEGTGVGLALVHRIITRHGGRVWAEAEKDKGAVFYFSLPERRNGDN